MKRHHAYAGNTFITMMLVMAVTVAFIAGALTYTQHLGRLSKRSRDAQVAMEIGDGCLENLFTHWRNIYRVVATGSPYVLPTNYFYTTSYHPAASPAGVPLIPTPKDSINDSTVSLFPNVPQNFTILQYRIQAVDPMIDLKTVGSDTEVSTMLDTDIPDGAYGPGLIQYSFYYLAAVDVQFPGLDGRTVTAKVRRVFEKKFNTPWNWAMCFNDDLEISPSKALTINGTVQANGNLYTGTNFLTLANSTNYVGTWNIGWAPGDTYHTGTPSSPNYPSNLPPAQGPNFLPFGLDARQLFNTADSNLNNDGYHELIERPNTSYSDPISAQRYYNQADVKVLIDNNNTVTIMNAAGTVISNSSPGAADKKLWNAVNNAISANKSFQDNREGGSVRVANLDIAKIYNGVSNGDISDNNGYGTVVYISDTSANSTTRRGIRLINGNNLPTNGLTIVSENPVYILGNFNTGGNNPNSNSGDPTKPTVNNYTAKPAAIMADSVTLQSISWADGDSTKALSSRNASNTTVNAALLAGIVPSSGGNYSGGAENFVRLMEDWTGKTLTYYGSMVQLFSSQQGIGTWGKANVYNAPTQYVYYDKLFQTKWPPGNLIFAGYLQQQRWYQVF